PAACASPRWIGETLALSMRLGPISLSKNAAQVWPQLVARYPGDALDLDHKLGVDEELAVRPVRDGLLGPSDCRSEGGLLRQSCIQKTPDKQFSFCVPAPGNPPRYYKGGIDLKHTCRRFASLSVAPEMGERGCETAVSSRRIGGELTLGFLTCGDGLVKAAKLNKGIPHRRKRYV